MTDFWKNTGKIAGSLAEWLWFAGLVVFLGLTAKVVWTLFRFGWRVLP